MPCNIFLTFTFQAGQSRPYLGLKIIHKVQKENTGRSFRDIKGRLLTRVLRKMKLHNDFSPWRLPSVSHESRDFKPMRVIQHLRLGLPWLIIMYTICLCDTSQSCCRRERRGRPCPGQFVCFSERFGAPESPLRAASKRCTIYRLVPYSWQTIVHQKNTSVHSWSFKWKQRKKTTLYTTSEWGNEITSPERVSRRVREGNIMKGRRRGVMGVGSFMAPSHPITPSPSSTATPASPPCSPHSHIHSLNTHYSLFESPLNTH